MGLQAYRRKVEGKRKAEVVQAIRVERPYRSVMLAFPRAHLRNKQSGKLDYIRLVDAEEGRNRAYAGDWVVKYPDGKVEVVPDHVFTAEFAT